MNLTVSRRVVLGVTLDPGRKVATLFAKKPFGAGGFSSPDSLYHEVSCINKKQSITVKPRSPIVHQNSNVHDLLEEIKAERVGPATLPKFKDQWNAVKALPLWCRKKRSTKIRGPRTPVTPPKKPEKNRETIKELN